jgi:hypothetical protein
MNVPPAAVTTVVDGALVIVMVFEPLLPLWFASPAYVAVAVQLAPSATVTGAEVQLPVYAQVTVCVIPDPMPATVAVVVCEFASYWMLTAGTVTVLGASVIVIELLLLLPSWFASPAYVAVAVQVVP